MARRRRILALAVLLALALGAIGAGPAHAIELGPPEPRSPNASSIETAYWVMLAVAAALAVAINLALVVAVARFRARRGHRPARLTAGRGALRPALFGFGALAVAVFVFGVLITGETREIEPSGPAGLGGAQTAQVGVEGLPAASPLVTGEEAGDEGPLEIDAIAQQWLWRFEYPGGRPGQRTFSYGELVVPVDTAVVLDVSSTDVIHSWWVPALGGQVQATPGSVARTWFKADREGRYPGRSTVFSGTSYPTMRAWVRVVSVPEYEAYVEQLARELNEAQGIVQQRQAEASEQ